MLQQMIIVAIVIGITSRRQYALLLLLLLSDREGSVIYAHQLAFTNRVTRVTINRAFHSRTVCSGSVRSAAAHCAKEAALVLLDGLRDDVGHPLLNRLFHKRASWMVTDGGLNGVHLPPILARTRSCNRLPRVASFGSHSAISPRLIIVNTSA